jgi:hypothetical protein
MNNTHNIQSTSCGPLGTADKILIEVGGFNILDTQCTVNYALIDSTNKLTIARGYKIMSGTDYENWGQDNTYVKNWLLNLLGITAA